MNNFNNNMEKDPMEVDKEVGKKSEEKNEGKLTKKQKIGEANDEKTNMAMDINNVNDDKSMDSISMKLACDGLLHILFNEYINNRPGEKVDQMAGEIMKQSIQDFEKKYNINVTKIAKYGFKDREERKETQKWILAKSKSQKEEGKKMETYFETENYWAVLCTMDNNKDDDIDV